MIGDDRQGRDEIRQFWRLLLEPKDHIKQRVGFFPDLGDAAALTFAVDFNEVVDAEERGAWTVVDGSSRTRR